MRTIVTQSFKTRDQQKHDLYRNPTKPASLIRITTCDSLDSLEFFDFVKFTENIGLPAIWCFESRAAKSSSVTKHGFVL